MGIVQIGRNKNILRVKETQVKETHLGNIDKMM